MTARLGPYRLTGIAAPLAVWALHFVAVYVMQGIACAEDWQRTRVAGLELVTWWLLLATAAALAVIAWLGLRALRARRPAGGGDGDADARRRHFTATLTAAAALIAAIAVLFTATPVLLLPPCA